MPKEVTELGQNKPFVIHQQEMFGGLIPVRSVMIALIMCAEGGNESSDRMSDGRLFTIG